MASDPGSLTSFQRELLELWLPGARVTQDHGWGLVDRLVLEVVTPDGGRYIAKASGGDDHHTARELAAYRRWVTTLSSIGRAPKFVRGNLEAGLLVMEYLPGQLVQEHPAERDEETYRQAGELLARFHGQATVLDNGEFEQRQQREALDWLRQPHRIAPDAVAALVEHIREWPSPKSVLVPTHGDWQPRNWLVDRGLVRVIDFGRSDLRPAHTDLARLAARQFRTDPMLELAFLDGYGSDPRDPAAWLRSRIREAVSTTAWAHRVGDEAFEAQGLAMVDDVLAELDWGA